MSFALPPMGSLFRPEAVSPKAMGMNPRQRAELIKRQLEQGPAGRQFPVGVFPTNPDDPQDFRVATGEVHDSLQRLLQRRHELDAQTRAVEAFIKQHPGTRDINHTLIMALSVRQSQATDAYRQFMQAPENNKLAWAV